MSPTVDTCSVWTILPRVSSWDWECISQPGKLRTKKWWLCSSAVWLLELNLMSWKVKWSTYIKKNYFEMVSVHLLSACRGQLKSHFLYSQIDMTLNFPLQVSHPFNDSLGILEHFCVFGLHVFSSLMTFISSLLFLSLPHSPCYQ